MNAERPDNVSKGAISLAGQIRHQIRALGPMSLATFMGLCLTHPKRGYYTSADPLGAQGDFITAPEISQMFGEMLGGWVLLQYQTLGRPDKFDLLELGPGRGTLMADVMRTIAKDREAFKACRVILLETSPVLAQIQRQKLKKYNPEWINGIGEISNKKCPVIVLANEFFDALPIRQFQFRDNKWREREVGLDGDELVWGLSRTPVPTSLFPPETANPCEGEIREMSPLAQKTVAELATILNRRGGSMLVVDYGYEHSRSGNSFQAVAGHEFADPLAAPGKADLSAHVDFEALVKAARERGARAQLAGSQGQILSELGIKARAKKLMEANPERSEAIRADLERLIAPDQMGELFKAMVVFGVRDTAPFATDGSLAELTKISHGFFGRRGGCSSGPNSNLNVSFATKDEPANVERNRAIAMRSLGLEEKTLVTLSQVHSNRVIVIGPGHEPKTRPEADGMVTGQKTIALGVLAADCTPVLLADPVANIIGACHAGWRGALAGVVANTVKAMVRLGASPKNIVAAIGPTIGPQNYQVGPDFAQKFLALYPGGGRYIVFPNDGASEHFDLPGFVLEQLRLAGVESPSQTGACTYQHPGLYFSHRFATHQGEATGRQMAIIALS